MPKKDMVKTFEFIGSEIEVSESEHEGYEGLKGKVIDETKNTLIIGNDRKKIVPKKGSIFEIEINGRRKNLDGSNITYRPEDRIKKLG